MKSYKYLSESQHVLYIMYHGIRKKIKFTTTFMGVKAMYVTTDEGIATRIRATEQFRRGLIQEIVEETEDIKAEVKKEKKKEEIAKQPPVWMQGSMKTAKQTGKTAAQAAKEVSEGVTSETRHTETKELFGIKIEDVDNLMDAKAYLRDVVGASTDEVRTRGLAKEYCKAKGIVFPNFEF